MIPDHTLLLNGALMFDAMDQIDLTGPFEVRSRVPNSSYRIYAKTGSAVGDLNKLRLIPDATLAEAPPLVSVFLSPNERLAKNEGLLASRPRLPPLHCPSC